jgi:hypothetical protein
MIVRTERRWQMALAVLVAIGLQLVTPRTGRVSAWWLLPVLEFVLLVTIITIDPGRVDDRSIQVRRLTIGLIAIMTIGTMAGVALLVYDILSNKVLFHPGVVLNATDLFGRGAALWVTNAIVFSLWFWEPDAVDRPSGRRPRGSRRARVPGERDAGVRGRGMSPIYPDYLYWPSRTRPRSVPPTAFP